MSGSPSPALGKGWQTAGVSVRGAAHTRNGAPNQDAWRIWQPIAGSLPLVLAVADGHGGAAYSRSHIGAAYAVHTAVRVLAQDLLPRFVSPDAPPDLALLKRTCDEWLPKVLVRRWQERVRRYSRRYPLPGPPVHSPESLTPYGATLLAALLTQHFHLYLQVGDGDILTVGGDGTVSRPALPADARLLGNETTSLCTADAWRSVRLAFQPVMGGLPALVLLSTDGYANSFVDSSSFEQVGADLLALIRSDGLAAVQAALPDWLARTSAGGSGDDVTVALAVA